MTIAYWCVLIAGLLPYVFTVAAKWSPEYSNENPREYLEKVVGWRKRAHWAQVNSFEAFPFFAAAVIIAQRTFVHQTTIDVLALLFVFSRIIYGVAYIMNKPKARSLIWFLGFACCIGLFLVSAKG